MVNGGKAADGSHTDSNKFLVIFLLNSRAFGTRAYRKLFLRDTALHRISYDKTDTHRERESMYGRRFTP